MILNLSRRGDNLLPKRLCGLLLLDIWLTVSGLSCQSAEPLQSPGHLDSSTAPELPAPPPSIAAAIDSAGANSAATPFLRVLSPGVFELGEVQLNTGKASVSFPAVINMTEGPLEYLLVSSYGKKHGSLLRTDVLPYNLHMAMLLLDVDAPTNAVSTPRLAHIKNPSADSIPGSKVTIEISWQAGGKTVRHRAEELVYNSEAKTALSQNSWVYNGSAVWDGHSLAQREGSIVSLVTDLSALINTAGPGHDNDHIWTASSSNMPAVNTPVVVTMRVSGRVAGN